MLKNILTCSSELGELTTIFSVAGQEHWMIGEVVEEGEGVEVV